MADIQFIFMRMRMDAFQHYPGRKIRGPFPGNFYSVAPGANGYHVNAVFAAVYGGDLYELFHVLSLLFKNPFLPYLSSNRVPRLN